MNRLFDDRFDGLDLLLMTMAIFAIIFLCWYLAGFWRGDHKMKPQHGQFENLGNHWRPLTGREVVEERVRKVIEEPSVDGFTFTEIRPRDNPIRLIRPYDWKDEGAEAQGKV